MTATGTDAELGIRPPLAKFLAHCYVDFLPDNSGAVADYIPELTKADPRHCGISLATIDGHVYEVGDSAVPFTIQSISKAFVFALALETLGAEHVEAVIGVEPSGEAFNSIRLRAGVATRPAGASSLRRSRPHRCSSCRAAW